jgi:uncharacterized protein with HEPN domain
MNEKDKRCAETIIDYCNRIDDYLNRFDDDKEIYMSDSLYKDACALVIIQMGEFANRFSDEFLEEYDGIEWGQLIGLRNVTAHNYENIIDDIIWEVMHEDVPEIKEYLEKILYKYFVLFYSNISKLGAFIFNAPCKRFAWHCP